ncbi:MAG: ThiF family adenylyltransferase, partial [Holdemania filiformis]
MEYLFIIVGVGGTGSLLARDLPKLLIGTNHKMILVDGDRVEKKNMLRQSYQDQDIGENKAVSLAAKINTFYDCQCEAMASY